MANTGYNFDTQDQGAKIGSPIIYNTPTPASYAAGAQTFLAADLLGATIVHDGTGNATDTFPTAAQMVAAIQNCRVGDTVECLIINGGATGTITLAAGTGGSFDASQSAGSRIIAATTSKYIQLRITNATLGSEAYKLYS